MMRVSWLPLMVILSCPTALIPQSEALTERFMLRAKAAYVGGYVVVNSTPCMAEKADGELLVGVEELEFRFQPKRGGKELENCRSLRPSQLDAKGRTKLLIH